MTQLTAPININNTVSRTCVPVRSLDGGQRITDLATVSVTIRKRSAVPFGRCEPGPVTDCPCLPCGQAPTPPDSELTYPAHSFTDDGAGICFHWDDKLWGRAPGRYMATVYLCTVCIGCFQLQVGKRFTLDTPTNVPFNPCDAAVDVCGTDVTICK